MIKYLYNVIKINFHLIQSTALPLANLLSENQQKMVHISIPGPSCKLQACYHRLNPSKIALVVPPHPQQGGTMHNRACVALSRAFIDSGTTTVRMNFRRRNNLHSSAFTNAKEEKIADDDLLRDAAAIIAWIQERHPIISELWISGYHFGSWIATNLVMRRPEATGLIAISPPVTKHDFTFAAPCMVPALFIHPESDVLTPQEEILAMIEKMQNKKSGLSYKTIPGADYRYSKKEDLQQIHQICLGYINNIYNGETAVYAEEIAELISKKSITQSEKEESDQQLFQDASIHDNELDNDPKTGLNANENEEESSLLEDMMECT